MSSAGTPFRAQASWPALVLLATTLAGRAASAGSETALEVELQGMPAEVQGSIRESVSRLHAQGVPPAPLIQKLREGRAKSVSDSRVAQLLARMTDDFLWLDLALAGCQCAKTAETRTGILTLGADILLGSLTRDELQIALEAVCTHAEGGQRLASAFEVFSYVSARLRANKDRAWGFALTLLKRQEPKAAQNQLVLVLQEIFKTHGNIDNALTFATSRLAAGATSRATANELKDQFLRH